MMNKKKRKNRYVLGLHTEGEMRVAYEMARKAIKMALDADSEGDLEKYIYYRAYALAIRDLALAEGAIDLVKDIDRITGRLEPL